MTDAAPTTETPRERLPAICYADGHDQWLPGVLSDRQIKHLVDQLAQKDKAELARYLDGETRL